MSFYISRRDVLHSVIRGEFMKESSYVKCERKVNFECQSCGICCKEFIVPIGRDDIAILEKKMGNISNRVIAARGVNTIIGKEVEAPSLKCPCPFFDNGSKACTIYELRPKACMVFPFYVKKEGKKMQYFNSSICPGVGKGHKIDLFHIHKTVKRLNSDIKLLKSIQMPGIPLEKLKYATAGA